MEGLFFYWIAWITWIISTFFMKKTKLRLEISVIMLVLLILTAHSFTIHKLTVNYGLLFLLLYGYIAIFHQSPMKLMYFYVKNLIITLLYACFYIFSVIDPVWIIFDAKWMLAIGLVYFVLILQTSLRDRIILLIMGVCHGEILYGLLLKQYHFHVTIGSKAFFDLLAISFLLIQSWYLLEVVSRHFELYMQKNFKQKSKQG